MIQHEGPGWRLQRDISRKKFTVLLGGENWSIEISEEEWQSLCPPLFELLDQFEDLKSQLLDEEMIFLEKEKEPWWASIDGTKYAWTLSLILSCEENGDRSLEVSWPIATSSSVTSAMRLMWDSQQEMCK